MLSSVSSIWYFAMHTEKVGTKLIKIRLQSLLNDNQYSDWADYAVLYFETYWIAECVSVSSQPDQKYFSLRREVGVSHVTSALAGWAGTVSSWLFMSCILLLQSDLQFIALQHFCSIKTNTSRYLDHTPKQPLDPGQRCDCAVEKHQDWSPHSLSFDTVTGVRLCLSPGGWLEDVGSPSCNGSHPASERPSDGGFQHSSASAHFSSWTICFRCHVCRDT